MQVILDSLFARPGLASIRGGKKREFSDWTNSRIQIMVMLTFLYCQTLFESKTSKTTSSSVEPELGTWMAQ